MRKSIKVWCVQSRDGWCATKNGKRPDTEANSVDTLCEYIVVLPFAWCLRKPTCKDCLAILKRKHEKATAMSALRKQPKAKRAALLQRVRPRD